jgi:hypothetical protein
MRTGLSEILRHKAINEWNLFWLITGSTSIAMVIAMMGTNLSSGEAVSSMIQLSVRCAIPWLYLAFAASSVQVLFPGQLNRWLLRNRKIMGLCFAAAMGWQLLFIGWLVTVYSDYYIEEVYVLRDHQDPGTVLALLALYSLSATLHYRAWNFPDDQIQGVGTPQPASRARKSRRWPAAESLSEKRHSASVPS